MSRRIALRDVNWLGDGDLSDLPADGLAVWARIRSSQPPQPATLLGRDGADGSLGMWEKTEFRLARPACFMIATPCAPAFSAAAGLCRPSAIKA